MIAESMYIKMFTYHKMNFAVKLQLQKYVASLTVAF